ncbi:MAG TPA: hypothetical protein VFW96_27885 [Thermomicrobiales bacterium]|nr:hypothetical protein [Thermomicrobiales bacterium]
MPDPREPIVQAIDEYAWEAAEVRPIGVALPIGEWLRRLRERGMRLGVVPPARIAGGPYDGGWVLSADDEDGRVYFAVPAEALPRLRDALSPEVYAALSRQAALPGSRRDPAPG